MDDLNQLNLSESIIERWLRETDPLELDHLWEAADKTRRKFVGNEVHLRGLIEISNYCIRNCDYCGLRASNKKVERYRLSKDEILGAVEEAVNLGYGTIVMQAGEDPGIRVDWLADIIESIKEISNVAITLSLGERDESEWRQWYTAGADRYLLRFETSDKELYERIHPSGNNPRPHRLEQLKTLKQIGYETGSGVMVGIPGQSFQSLAHDISLFRELDLDMIGIGPFIPCPGTPLAENPIAYALAGGSDQVRNDDLSTLKALALTRLVRPDANIPSTTALGTINPDKGRELGLKRGANIVMPNFTPMPYRKMYAIYPDKASLSESADHIETGESLLRQQIKTMGRTVGTGQGSRPGFIRKQE